MRVWLVFLLSYCVFSICALAQGKRPFVIGASLAAGFHTTEYKNWKGHPKSDALSFDKALAKLLPDHDEIPLQGSRFFFMAVDSVGKTQIDKALAHKADTVFAVDYLFWHFYGDLPDKTDGARMRLLEK